MLLFLPRVLAFVVSLGLALPLLAGTTGKISGRVTDALTGEPLIGVNVVIAGTSIGAATDIEGDYSILNLKPGTYELLVSYTGYQTQRIQNVQVIVDKTTTVDIELSEAVIEGEEVIVTAERPLVEMDRTTTTSVVDAEQLDVLPVTGIGEVINLQAGVVDGHFRGGRLGEVAYLVNGVPINNAYTNTAAFTVEQNMIESLEVISGVFNAEYGQAMSGIVNIVTKDVPDQWTGSLLSYVGGIASTRELEFVERLTPPGNGLARDDFESVTVPYYEAANPVGRQDVQLSLGGPLFRNRLGLRFTGRYYRDEGHTIGRRVFLPADSSQGLNSGIDPAFWQIESTGDQDFVPSRNRRYSLNGSLVYNLSSRLRLDYNLFWQDGRSRGYNQQRKYVPEGDNWNYTRSQTHIAGLRWTISNTSFANLSYSFLHDKFDSRLYDIPDNFTSTGILDSRYVSPQVGSTAGAQAFAVGGNALFNADQLTSSHAVVADFTSQVTKVHQIKAGASARFHTLDNLSYGIEVSSRTAWQPRPSPDRYQGDTLTTHPFEFAAYLQDKMEFRNLIVNAGVRFDLFRPDYLIPIRWEEAGQEFIPDPENPGEVVYNREEAPMRTQISPRFGVAFPISSQGVIRFSAGLFFQIPPFRLLYTNPEYQVNPAAASVQFGNPAIDPERTLTFEVGLQQGLNESLGLELTLFSKDIRNLIGQQFQRDVETTNFTVRYINRDVGTVRGVTLSVFQRPVGPLSWDLDYTLQFAEGTASNPNEAFARQQSGLEDVLGLVRLNWDRRHVFTNSITLAPLDGLTLTMINRYQTGTPYTTVRRFIRSYIENNGTKPDGFTSDLRLYYRPSFLDIGAQLFLQVDNLFDNQVANSVYANTGLPNESVDKELFRRSGTQIGGVNSLDEYYFQPGWFNSPRRVSLGVRYEF